MNLIRSPHSLTLLNHLPLISNAFPSHYLTSQSWSTEFPHPLLITETIFELKNSLLCPLITTLLIYKSEILLLCPIMVTFSIDRSVRISPLILFPCYFIIIFVRSFSIDILQLLALRISWSCSFSYFIIKVVPFVFTVMVSDVSHV